MAINLVWHPLALKDLEQILNYCSLYFGKQIARKVRGKYRKDIASLKGQPRLGFIEPRLKEAGSLEYRSF